MFRRSKPLGPRPTTEAGLLLDLQRINQELRNMDESILMLQEVLASPKLSETEAAKDRQVLKRAHELKALLLEERAEVVKLLGMSQAYRLDA